MTEQTLPGPEVSGRAWADPDAERVSTLISASRDKGWREALAELAPTAPFFAKRMQNLGLGNWHMLLLRNRDDRSLDIGCGFGSLPLGLSGYFRTAVGTEFLADRIAYASLRASEDERYGCRFVRSNGHSLPFGRGSFDLATMNGVLEWAGLYGKGDPRELQLRMLREVRRILSGHGNIAVAIENRMALESILGLPDTHTGVIWATVLPQWLAGLAMRVLRGRPLRTRLYTPRGYRRLFTDAGFGQVRVLDLISSYNDYDYIVDLDDRASYRLLYQRDGVRSFYSLAGSVREFVAPRWPRLASRVGYANLIIAGRETSTILDPGHRFWHIAAESGASPGEARFACQGTDAGQVAVVAHDGKDVTCVVELGADRAQENGSILSPRLQKLFLEGLVPAGRFSVSGIECRVHRRQAQA